MKMISLILPAQEAKMGGELGAVLGQHGVNIVKFCKEFNDTSIKFEHNMPIKVNLIIESNANFKIDIKGPVSTFLLQSYKKSNNSLFLLDLYKIILIKRKTNSLIDEKPLFKSLLATIKSMRYNVNYE